MSKGNIETKLEEVAERTSIKLLFKEENCYKQVEYLLELVGETVSMHPDSVELLQEACERGEWKMDRHRTVYIDPDADKFKGKKFAKKFHKVLEELEVVTY